MTGLPIVILLALIAGHVFYMATHPRRDWP